MISNLNTSPASPCVGVSRLYRSQSSTGNNFIDPEWKTLRYSSTQRKESDEKYLSILPDLQTFLRDRQLTRHAVIISCLTISTPGNVKLRSFVTKVFLRSLNLVSFLALNECIGIVLISQRHGYVRGIYFVTAITINIIFYLIIDSLIIEVN